VREKHFHGEPMQNANGEIRKMDYKWINQGINRDCHGGEYARRKDHSSSIAQSTFTCGRDQAFTDSRAQRQIEETF